MSLNKLAVKINQTAHDKGWYENPRSFGEVAALFHSEISEALEEWRNGHELHEVYHVDSDGGGWLFEDGNSMMAWVKEHHVKPEGVPIELADAIIRILDTCAENGIDIDTAIAAKMEYNEGRPYRHGGKKA